MAVWFTSDHHFGHANVIQYCNRPFADVHSMNWTLTHLWQCDVKPQDDVWYLGDFTLGRPDRYIDRLPGRLHLIVGNHDDRRSRKHPRWLTVTPYQELKLEGQRIVLSHYPFETWNAAHRGSWHLHGHSHGNLRARGRRLDVGVDTRDFRLYALKDVARIMAGRQFEKVDHHGERSAG